MKKIDKPNNWNELNKEYIVNYKIKDIDYKKIAIIILTYSDFESFEVAIAAISKFTNKNIDIFVLQNGYNIKCNQCIKVAKKYMELYKNIKIIYPINNKNLSPWLSISDHLLSENFNKYEYIIKIDDDTFPLDYNWVDNIISSINDETPIVTPICTTSTEHSVYYALKINNLYDDFINSCWVPHFSGRDETCTNSVFCSLLNSGINKFNFSRKFNDFWGGYDFSWEGTSCGPSHFIRWFHENMSLKPEKLLNNSKKYKNKKILIPTSNYLTINAIGFKKDFWLSIYNTFKKSKYYYDEIFINNYLINNEKYWGLLIDTPIVHIHRYKHRSENGDLNKKFYCIYEKYLDLKWPISIWNYEERLLIKNNYEIIDQLESIVKNNKSFIERILIRILNMFKFKK